jgi:hypothetical protein
MVPMLLLLVANREWVAVWLVALVFWVGPPYFGNEDGMHDLHLAWWEQFTSATYVLAGLGVMALVLCRPAGRSAR